MKFPSLPPSSFQFVWTTLLFLWLPRGVYGTGFEIDTPPRDTLTQCETTKLTWKGGDPPFTLHIRYQKDNSLVQEFHNLTNNSLLWLVNVTAGSQLYLELLDSSDGGKPADSATFVIQPGNDSCLQSSAASSGTNTGIDHQLLF